MAAQWTDLEILTTYRQAADKNKQIGILAELTGKSKLQIIEILRAGGEKVDGRIVGGARGGKARAKKEAEIKSNLDQPRPEPTPTTYGMWLDTSAVAYLRGLYTVMDAAQDAAERSEYAMQIASIVGYLTREGC